MRGCMQRYSADGLPERPLRIPLGSMLSSLHATTTGYAGDLTSDLRENSQPMRLLERQNLMVPLQLLVPWGPCGACGAVKS